MTVDQPRTALPLRPELAGLHPYGAPQLEVPVRLNVNENPYPPSPAVVADIAAAVRDAAGSLNRYPDRDFADLRADLAAYLLAESGVHLDPAQIWAANGSNEVMLHILQAFGGPGRTAVSFAPTYSMYPEYARDTSTRWVTGRREEDFSLDPDHAAQVIAQEEPTVVLLASPNNPTGTALPTATVMTPAAAGSRVPPWPTRRVPTRRRTAPTTSWLDMPGGLSTFSSPKGSLMRRGASRPPRGAGSRLRAAGGRSRSRPRPGGRRRRTRARSR